MVFIEVLNKHYLHVYSSGEVARDARSMSLAALQHLISDGIYAWIFQDRSLGCSL